MDKKTRLGMVLFSLLVLSSSTWAAQPAKAKKSAQPQSTESVWVIRSDEAKSCSPDSGVSLKEDSETLKAAKIPVIQARKGNDGKMYAQMCGAPTGSVNAFLIPKGKLGDAIALGFKEAPHP